MQSDRSGADWGANKMINLQIFSDASPLLLRGLGVTLYIGLTSLILSFALGLLLALMRQSGKRWLENVALSYSTVVRGTPLLVQLFVIYYGIGSLAFMRESVLWWIWGDGMRCTILAVSLNSGAYIGEVLRGGFQAVPRGQMEAARACGMSGVLSFRRIVLPLAIRHALAAYGNEMVLVIKGTSLASTIAVMDLTGYAKLLMSRTYAVIEIFALAGCMYLLINLVLIACLHAVEWWLTPRRKVAYTAVAT